MRKTYSQAQISLINHFAAVVGDNVNFLVLFELINCGPKSFNELKRMTATNQVTLSKKLKFLISFGYIDCTSVGKTNIYTVNEKCTNVTAIFKKIGDQIVHQ